MKPLGLHEIRSEFLKFYESKKHLALPSFSLVPKNDKSLLLIGAGMAPMKKFFTGEAVPPASRVCTSQKCIRTGDIENVGKTDRHATFFEMLGNFSFGDYFKSEAIPWAWEFLTEVLEIDPDRLWATIYLDDDEAFRIWNEEVGLPKERIVRLGKEDNFWELSVGPSGPCSEIYFDRGEKHGCGKPDCKPGCDCDRYIEVWNLVFTQFDKDEEGNYHPLARPNIDTGMGLERIATVLQETNNIFEIDAIHAILEDICEMAGYEYGTDPKLDMSVRVITDHIRAITFMISDSIIPSNEGRGYVERRLTRRAAKHGRNLGIQGAFLYKLADSVIDSWKVQYRELEDNREVIQRVILREEERFLKTLETGMELLESEIDKMKKEERREFSGEDAFKLYDTYGFPLDLTREILEESGMTLDEAAFDEKMEAQKNRARVARDDSDNIGWSAGSGFDLNDIEEETDFVGYETLDIDGANLLHIIVEGEDVERVESGEKAIFYLNPTPFYGESGGQVGDTGVVEGDGFTIRIEDAQKTKSGHTYVIGTVTEGVATPGSVSAHVDRERREKTRRNHSVTHLLHQALKDTLGDHVNQAGSHVGPDMMRFDFTHYEAVSAEDIQTIEEIVNRKIFESLPVRTEILSYDEAKETGAVGLFEDKYGDKVRVVSMGDYSKELCGGTHVENTAQIGMFKILSESGISAGVRRMETVTGPALYRLIKVTDATNHEAAVLLKASEGEIIKKLKHHLKNEKNLEKELDRLNAEIAKSRMRDQVGEKETIAGIDVIRGSFRDVSVEDLRNMAENLRDKEDALVILSTVNGEKLNFVCASPKDVISRGFKAGDIVRNIAKIAGGGGGGRPDMATAGGKDVKSVDKAMHAVEDILNDIGK
ncbi:MAG: alanine--tRNA ligase [Peptoniphilus sp.]|nr:alanine--tRNA ligase [Peptoniphilus sp.]MDD7363827.1 alanine--tRNA ligase [Bacillota bacterium]MDY6044334.1 alanine--tRNA ligase [Peptoniphilus sp.]